MTSKTPMKDYGTDGIDIQTAMIRHVKAHPDRTTRTKYIIWNGCPVWTSFELRVPNDGGFRIEFLSPSQRPLQGVDVKAEGGEVILHEGERVNILRTWNDPRYENIVEYGYKSKAGLLNVWNVYQHTWPDGRATEEKWRGNAGFLVEEKGEGRWVFRCSDGPSEPPNFAQLVFRISLRGE